MALISKAGNKTQNGQQFIMQQDTALADSAAAHVHCQQHIKQ